MVRAGVLLASLAMATATAQRYVVTELPSGSPYGALAWDINDAGVAVGDNLTATLQRHALTWSATGVRDLTPTNALAQAQGISQSGLVAGWQQNAGGQTEATRWQGSTGTLLGWLPGHIGSLAQDVNDQGLVAGWSVTSVGDPVAVVWQNGQVLAIDGAHSWAFAVSETGDVVGRRWVGTSIEAIRWRNGQTTRLADLGRNHAQAVGISPAGRVAGSAQAPNGVLHAVAWRPDGTLDDLGPFITPSGSFGAQANDVNDKGIAAGTAIIDPVREIFYAMVWRGGPAEDLNTLIQPGTDWTLIEAQAVNARGEIAGIGVRSGAAGPRAFLLRPDCDGDGIADLDEIAAGTAYDANRDGIDDACQHCQGNLGFAGPGTVALSICGDALTAAATAATFAIQGAAPAAPVLLVGGLTNQPTPMFGGTLVPGEPRFLVVGLVAGADGRLAFPIHGAGAVPVTLFLQGVALAGPQLQFSNAVRLVLGLP
jgi:uncharacterized membrane protein